VFENKVLQKIYGPKRDKVTGEWRRQHTEELGVYESPTKTSPANISTKKIASRNPDD